MDIALSNKKSKKAQIHTLSNGVKGTLIELAELANTTSVTISTRLKQSNDADFVLKKPVVLEAKIHKLSDGTQGTAREFARQCGVAENTINHRLKSSNDPDVVLANPIKRKNSQKKYCMNNGDILTVAQLKQQRNCSDSMAYRILQSEAILSTKTA